MSDRSLERLQEMTKRLQESASAAIGSDTGDAFGLFERQLSEFDAACREVQQSMWSDEAKVVIRRLEAGDPLTPSDLDVIRAFLISDAEQYLAMENSYQEWLAELRRLLESIASRACIFDRKSIAELRGVVKDAVRLVPDIRNYLEEHDRVNRCEAALKSLDADSRVLLARILKEDLQSSER